MFDHVSIGVRDMTRAKRFYDAALAPLGYKCLRDTPALLGYGSDSVARALLNLLDQLSDLLGLAAAALGQFADFVGDDREASAVFARPRRLYRRI